MSFILPILVVLAFGLIDLGRAFYYQVAITGAATEGARYGARHAGTQLGAAQAAAASEVAPLPVSVTASQVSGPPRKVRVRVQYSFKLVTPLVSALVAESGTIPLEATSEEPYGLDHSNGRR